jgi:hypothetical protein
MQYIYNYVVLQGYIAFNIIKKNREEITSKLLLYC